MGVHVLAGWMVVAVAAGIPSGALRGDPRVAKDVLSTQPETCTQFREWLKDKAVVPARTWDWLLPADCVLKGAAAELMDGGAALNPSVYADRFAADENGKPLAFADGTPMPFEPLQLNLGPVKGPRSSAWALMALHPDAADKEELLRADPRKYAAPMAWPGGPVAGLGITLAQAYFNLAVLTQLWNGPGAPALAHHLLGRSLFHVGALAQAANTVQLGFDGYEEEARLMARARKFSTLGGYLEAVPSPVTWARTMRDNHRTWMDALVDRRIAEARATFEREEQAGKPPAPLDLTQDAAVVVWPALLQDDGEYKKDMEMAVAKALSRNNKQEYLPALAVALDRLVEFASRDGPETHRHALAAAAPALRDPAFVYDPATMDPEQYAGDKTSLSVKAHLDSLVWMRARSHSRAGTAVRLAYARFRADGEVKDDAQRTERAKQFATATHRAFGEWEVARVERIAALVKAPPPPAPGPVKDPGFVAMLLGVPLLLLGVVMVGIMAARRSEERRKDMERIQLPGA